MKVAVLDFGSQLTQLVARRVRDFGIYSEVFPFDVEEKILRQFSPIGIILSGSDQSTVEENSPRAPDWLWDFGCPILGLCYGMQIMAKQLGGKTTKCNQAEFGYVQIDVIKPAEAAQPQLTTTATASACAGSGAQHLLSNLPSPAAVWMSHSDQVCELPPGFVSLAQTASCPIASMGHLRKPLFGIQFHPEVSETLSGREIFRNFLFKICECGNPSWTVDNILTEIINKAKEDVAKIPGHGDVILGLSGGVDSSVVAAILHKAIGSRLKCIIIDTGLMRKDEVQNVMKAFQTMTHSTHPQGCVTENQGCVDHTVTHPEGCVKHPSGVSPSDLYIEVVDASDRFFSALAGVSDPEEKRKIIGSEFISVFSEVSLKFSNVSILAQGTIYPDVIESAKIGNAALIKTHHNVGGLPDDLKFALLEPLRKLFKDEVRKIGEALGLPHQFLYRHPFPGPGLGVRILGEVTKERARKLQHADHIFIEEIQNHGIYYQISQALAALIPVKAVAVKGDAREYDEIITLRAVNTEDFMTAQVTDIPGDLLKKIARRITNEVKGVTRVLYDYTDKPPATIEYE